MRNPLEKSSVCQSPSSDDISSIQPQGAQLNNGESVCAGGMLDSSSPEDADCGTDKGQHVLACFSLLGWGEGGGAAVGGASPYLAPLRNTTQSGEECANHTLGPTVTLFSMLCEICAFALSAFPPTVP